jgi:hypothetical protein
MVSLRAITLAIGSIVLVPAGAVRAEDVVLAVSRPCFAPADTVAFTLSNHRPANILMPYSPPWDIFETATNTHVAPLIHFTSVVELGGGSSATFTWLQNDHDGNQVPAGEYRIEVRYTLQYDPWILIPVSSTFEIRADCSPTMTNRRPWGGIRDLFR